MDYPFIIEIAIHISELEESILPLQSNSLPVPLVTPFDIPPDDYTHQSIKDAFGFTPKSGFSLRLDKFDKDDAAIKGMIKTIVSMISKRQIKNAALLFQGEIPVLWLESGALFVNDARGYWNPDRLASLGMPYAFKSMRPL